MTGYVTNRGLLETMTNMNLSHLSKWAAMIALAVSFAFGAVAPVLAQEIAPETLALARKYVDLSNKQQIFEAISQIAESGVTILVVEQNTRLALRYAARAYVLRTGEIAMEGPAKELAQNEEIKAAYLGG